MTKKANGWAAHEGSAHTGAAISNQCPYHTKETCWKLHGKSANWKPMKQGEGRGLQANVEENKPVGSAFTKEQFNQLQALFLSPLFC